MGFFARSIKYGLLTFFVLMGFLAFGFFSPDNEKVHFFSEYISGATTISVILGFFLSIIDPLNYKPKKNPPTDEGGTSIDTYKISTDEGKKSPQNSKIRASKTAKLGVALGAAALVKASHKPKNPICTPRNSSIVRNIQAQHLGGDKWRIHCQTYAGTHWRNFQHDITPRVGGFSADGASIDVIWK